MPLEKLVQRILADARDYADELLNEAKLRRLKLLEEASAKADERYGELIDEARRSAEEEKQKRMTVALLEGRRIVLEAKQRIVQDVFDRAIESFLSLPAGLYVSVLAPQVAEAAGGRRWELVLSGRDRDAVGESLVVETNRILEDSGSTGRVSLSDRTAEISGGFVLEGEDLEIDGSLEALLDARREELEEQIIDSMFGNLSWISKA